MHKRSLEEYVSVRLIVCLKDSPFVPLGGQRDNDISVNNVLLVEAGGAVMRINFIIIECVRQLYQRRH